MTFPSKPAKGVPEPRPERAGAEAQDIESLRRRYERLNREKIEAETALKHHEKALGELKDKARAEYGTDDLEELRRKLEEMRRSNDEKRTRYQAALEAIERDLKEVDGRYREALEAEGKG